MVERRRFWAGALVKGWHEVVDVNDHIGVALGLILAGAALLGIHLGFRIPVWVSASGFICLVMAIVILDGAFLESRSSKSDISIDAKRDIREKLGRYLDEGRRLFSRYIQNENEFQAWKDEVIGWRDRVRTVLETEIGAPELAIFNDVHPAASEYSRQFNQDHGAVLANLQAYNQKLTRLIEAI